jgi:hypothetical protein
LNLQRFIEARDLIEGMLRRFTAGADLQNRGGGKEGACR